MDLGYYDQHVLVDYCKTGNGVARTTARSLRKWTRPLKLRKWPLVKLTKSQLDDIIKAGTVAWRRRSCRTTISIISTTTAPMREFHGINGNVNTDVKAPYQVCTVHTKEAWEAYEKAHPSKPSNPTHPPRCPFPATPPS